MTGLALAEAAEGLIGAPWRLHGRDPQHGLDCIGLLSAALARIGKPLTLPSGYTLRLSSLAGWLPDPQACGFARAHIPFEPGDAILLLPGPGQVHLAIADRAGGWIHAHAGLRQVIREPGLPRGTIIHHWRLAPVS